MSAATLVETREIDEAYNGLSSLYRGQKQHYFALVYLMKRFQISAQVAASHIDFAGNECGIDAFYHEKSSRSLFLFQFKCSDDHLSFKDSLEKFVLVGVPNIFAHAPLSEQYESRLPRGLQRCISQNQPDVDRIVIQLIFSGDPLKAEKSRVLDMLREYIESKKYIMDGYFGRPIDIIFQVISSKKKRGHSFYSKRSSVYSVSFEGSLKVQSQDRKLIVTLVPLGTLLSMYTELGDKFFEKNIRSGVSNGKTTRSEIKESLKKILAGDEQPENFTFYHNGVTLTAQHVDLDDTSIRMTEPRLLNGVQTVKTLSELVDANKKRRGRVVNMLSRVTALARIVLSTDDEFLKKVTISNNRQNPIMPWNLRANDLKQLQLEELFRDRLGIYYERRENALEDLSDSDLGDMSIAHRKAIRIRKLAQTFLALHGEVERISQVKEVFESEKWYHDTFRERYLSTDLRNIVLLYKVNYRLNAVVKEIHDLGRERDEYVGRLRNLVWCLAIQGILNDVNLEHYVKTYGSSLITEASFNLILKNMACMKLRLVIMDTLSDRKYRESLAQGKYSLLKTKAAFNDCMATGKRHFGWEKKDL